jgi:hypothetical protein
MTRWDAFSSLRVASYRRFGIGSKGAGKVQDEIALFAGKFGTKSEEISCTEKGTSS